MRDARVVLRADIDKAFTEVIAKYITNGYVAHTATMGGTQGEIGKIDVTNNGGNTIYRIVMGKEYNVKLDEETKYEHYRAIIIEVRKYVRGVDFNHNTLWNDKGTLVENYVWYEVRDDKVYTTDKEFVREADAKRDARWRRWEERIDGVDRIFTNATITDKLMTYINNRKGFKAVKKRDINAVWRRDNRYYIDFKNREGRYTVCNK